MDEPTDALQEKITSIWNCTKQTRTFIKACCQWHKKSRHISPTAKGDQFKFFSNSDAIMATPSALKFPQEGKQAMTRLILTSCLLLISGCVQTTQEKGLTHQDMKSRLIERRGINRVCSSSSPECMQWTRLAFQCEQNMVSEKEIPFTTGLIKPCHQMDYIQDNATGSRSDFNF